MYVVFDPQAGAIYTYDLKQNAFSMPRPVPALTPPPVPAPPSSSSSNGDGDDCNAGAGQTAAVTTSPAAPASQQGIAGNAASGVAYFNGRQVFYLTDIGNSKAKWKKLPDAPFAITSICGDLKNGIVIQNGDMLAQITNGFPQLWQSTAVSPRVPIRGMAGDGTNGIAVFRDLSKDLTDFDGDNKFVPSVYTFIGKPYSAAQSTQEPPIQIDLLVGDGASGYLAFGENQLFSLDAKGVWSKLVTVNFGLNAAVGNAKDGLLALIGTENFLVSTDLKTWTLQQPLPTLPVSAPAKSNSTT